VLPNSEQLTFTFELAAVAALSCSEALQPRALLLCMVSCGGTGTHFIAGVSTPVAVSRTPRLRVEVQSAGVIYRFIQGEEGRRFYRARRDDGLVGLNTSE
jgi:hypothetical protein